MTGQEIFEDDYSIVMEDKFIRLIEEKSGIMFDNVKRRELKRNISVCMRELGETSFRRYFNRLTLVGGDGEPVGKDLKKLINFITINETYFFRVKEHFDILENTVLPALAESKKGSEGKPLTVWSAGASSGEEVYSIVITLMENPGFNRNFSSCRVLGTDINEDMLYIAGKGIYSGRTLNKVPTSILQNYFEPFRDRFKVRDIVKRQISFRYLNLAEPFQHRLGEFSKPDIIFFRNVLIYFSKEVTGRIIETFYQLLGAGGFLFLGPSETLWNISDKFELLMFERAYIYRKGDPSRIKKPAVFVPVSTEIFEPPLFPPVEPGSPVVPSYSPPSSVPSADVSPAGDIFPSVEDKLRIMQDEAALMIELGDYRKAGELVDEMMSMESNPKPAVLLKMILFANQAQEEQLTVWARKALEAHPVFPEVHFILGRFYEAGGKVNEALQEYRKVLFIHQDYLLARERLMRLLYHRGEVSPAQREARNILDQLNDGRYKEFEYVVGERVNKESLKQFCRRVLG